MTPHVQPVPPQQLDLDQVISRIRQTVAEHHGVQTYAVLLLRASSIPKTSSGKIQRRACRAAYLEQSLVVIRASQPTPRVAGDRPTVHASHSPSLTAVGN